MQVTIGKILGLLIAIGYTVLAVRAGGMFGLKFRSPFASIGIYLVSRGDWRSYWLFPLRLRQRADASHYHFGHGLVFPGWFAGHFIFGETTCLTKSLQAFERVGNG